MSQAGGTLEVGSGEFKMASESCLCAHSMLNPNEGSKTGEVRVLLRFQMSLKSDVLML